MMTMVVGVFIVFGLVAYKQMPVELLPRFDLPYIMVTIVYPGASPEDVETAILVPVEEALGKVNRVTTIRTNAVPDAGRAIIQLEMDTNTDKAVVEIRNELEKIAHELPPGAWQPQVNAIDLNAAPIMTLAVTSDRPLEELTTWVEDHIETPLSRIEGVASVELTGDRREELAVEVDQGRMLAHHLTLGHVVEAVRSRGIDLPAGTVEDEEQAVAVRLAGAFRTVEDVADTYILSPTGELVQLTAVAAVEEGLSPEQTRARINGQPCIGVSIYKMGDANTVALGQKLRAALDATALPADLEIRRVHDSSTIISQSVNNLIGTMTLCILLTASLLYLFLHDLRGTAIVAIAIPASIVATLSFVYLAGFSINYMTLMGLAISVGTMVDASIVVLESIAREAEAGYTGPEAANRGTGNVVPGVLGSTVTNILVFTPIAFMKGIAGKFLVPFALTISFSMVFALFMSFTLTPMLASYLYRKGSKGVSPGPLARLWNRGFSTIREGYRGVLRWTLAHRAATLAGLLAIFVAAMVGLGDVVSRGWFVDPDQGFFILQLSMPAGSSLDETEQALERCEAVLMAHPAVHLAYGAVGQYGTLFGPIASRSEAELRVVLDAGHPPTGKVIGELRPLLARSIPGADIVLKELGGGETAVRDDFMIEVIGPNQARVSELADRVMEALEEQPNVVDIGRSGDLRAPQIRVTPDASRLAAAGITSAQLAMLLRVAIEGDTEARLRSGDDEQTIRVRLRSEDRLDIQRVAATTVQTPSGAQIPLRELARVEEVQAPSSISRQDRNYRTSVFANLAFGASGDTAAALAEALDLENLEEPYEIHIGGEEEQRAEAVGEIRKALLLAVILTFMLLAGLLESFVHPWSILATLPLALIGVLGALAASGVMMDIFGMMALVMLVGIVVNNAILMLEETNRLRADGVPIGEALEWGALLRLRPILMTSLSTIAGMIPLALALGAGAELRQAMALVSIGGVGTSSLLILVACPVLYHLMESMRRNKPAPPAADDDEVPESP